MREGKENKTRAAEHNLIMYYNKHLRGVTFKTEDGTTLLRR